MDVVIQTPEDMKTPTLLMIFLKLPYDEKYSFLCPRGESINLMQRIRVTLSRKRNIAKLRGVNIQEFRLRSDVVPHERGDLVTVWRQQTITSQLTEIFEDMKRK